MPRILIVEDDDLGREVLMRRLARRGYEVIAAEDGAGALSRVRADGPDIVLINLGPPNTNGWTAIRTLKANSATRHIPVIALTERATAEDHDRAVAIGCDDFAAKPIDLPHLLTKIEARLHDAQSAVTQLPEALGAAEPLAAASADALEAPTLPPTAFLDSAPPVAAEPPDAQTQPHAEETLAGEPVLSGVEDVEAAEAPPAAAEPDASSIAEPPVPEGLPAIEAPQADEAQAIGDVADVLNADGASAESPAPTRAESGESDATVPLEEPTVPPGYRIMPMAQQEAVDEVALARAMFAVAKGEARPAPEDQIDEEIGAEDFVTAADPAPWAVEGTESRDLWSVAPDDSAQPVLPNAGPAAPEAAPEETVTLPPAQGSLAESESALLASATTLPLDAGPNATEDFAAALADASSPSGVAPDGADAAPRTRLFGFDLSPLPESAAEELEPAERTNAPEATAAEPEPLEPPTVPPVAAPAALAKRAMAPAPIRKSAALPPDGGEAVLVIDANDRRRPMLGAALAPRWAATTLTASVADGLDLLLERRIDALVLDATSAAADAPGVLESLKSDDALRTVPVIVMCGRDAVEFFVQAGADDILLPPFDPALVQWRVAKVLEARRRPPAPAAAEPTGAAPTARMAEQQPRPSSGPFVAKPIAARPGTARPAWAEPLPAESVEAEPSVAASLAPRRVEAAVLVAGPVGFSMRDRSQSAAEAFTAIQAVFRSLEAVAARHGLVEISRTGHRFTAVAGMGSMAADATLDAVRCGLDMIQAAERALLEWPLAVGIDTGPLLVGQFGEAQPRFDAVGETAEIALQAQRVAPAGTVLVTKGAWEWLAGSCEGAPAGVLDLPVIGDPDLRQIELFHCRAATGTTVWD